MGPYWPYYSTNQSLQKIELVCLSAASSSLDLSCMVRESWTGWCGTVREGFWELAIHTSRPRATQQSSTSTTHRRHGSHTKLVALAAGRPRGWAGWLVAAPRPRAGSSAKAAYFAPPPSVEQKGARCCWYCSARLRLVDRRVWSRRRWTDTYATAADGRPEMSAYYGRVCRHACMAQQPGCAHVCRMHNCTNERAHSFHSWSGQVRSRGIFARPSHPSSYRTCRGRRSKQHHILLGERPCVAAEWTC